MKRQHGNRRPNKVLHLDCFILVFFAQKVEHEGKTHTSRSFLRQGTPAFERVYCAK